MELRGEICNVHQASRHRNIEAGLGFQWQMTVTGTGEGEGQVNESIGNATCVWAEAGFMNDTQHGKLLVDSQVDTREKGS